MMNNKSVISVILPVSGDANAMNTAVKSILEQTYSNWELLLVGNSVAGGSSVLCEELAAEDGRIHVAQSESDELSHARNAGIVAAHGEWIAFLNAGESYADSAFEKMMEYADGTDVIVSSRINQAWSYPAGEHSMEVWKARTSNEEIAEVLKDGCLRTVCGKLYRRSRLYAPFDENISNQEEYLFNTENLPSFENITIVPIIGYIVDRKTWNTENAIKNMSYPDACRRIRTNLVHALPYPGVTAWADREFVKAIVYYIYHFINSNPGITSFEKSMLIQMMLDEAVTPETRNIPMEQFSRVDQENWNILCTGTPEEIIAEFSAEAYRKRAEKFNTDESKHQGDKIKRGMPMRSFKIELAGIPMEVLHRYDLIKEACRDYLIPDDTGAAVSFATTDDRMQFSRDYVKKESGNDLSDDAAELDATHYDLYGKLTEFDAFWLHSVIVEREGKGYAFTAKPETGKSTHAKLWLKAFPDARIINGDNAIIRRQPDGTFYAYGTPFCGKEGYHVNTGVPLKGICFLSRGKENRIRPFDPDFAVNCLCRDNFCITPENAEAHLRLYRQLTEQVPCYLLECNMDVEAALVAWQGMNREDAE